MRLTTIIFSLLLLPACIFAESLSQRSMNPHELRIGWGDQLFEHMMWHSTVQPANSLPATFQQDYNESVRYTQHWFAEYQYRYNDWFSYGGQIGGAGVLWDKVTRNGKGDEVARIKNRCFYNILILPTIYFTYYHHDYVSLYSGLGLGLDINAGTEKDFDNRLTVCAPAINVTLFAVRANYNNWFASFEMGGVTALNNFNEIYLLGSRVLTLSLGLTF